VVQLSVLFFKVLYKYILIRFDEGFVCAFQNLPHATGLLWDQCPPDKEGGWKQCCLGKEKNYNPLILQPLSREGEAKREETSWNTTGLHF